MVLIGCWYLVFKFVDFTICLADSGLLDKDMGKRG